MKMIPGCWYSITEKFIVRTKPWTEAIALLGGVFVRETKRMYKFAGFSVKKSCVVRIREYSEEERKNVESFEALLSTGKAGMEGKNG